MTDERFRELMNGASLSDAEIAEGWHFCIEWDFMLIHPNDPEGVACSCLKE